MTRPGPSRRQALGLGLGLAATTLGARSTSARAAATPAVFRRGVNTWPWFALTREYPAPRTDFAWPPYQDGRPTPRPLDLRRLAAAGFDFIRLPVDPGPFLNADPEQFRMLAGALREAVSSAADAGLGVVVNLQPNEATHFWRSQNLIASLAAPKFPAYRDLVHVVAGDLGRMGVARLALEPVNEPPQDCASPAWPAVQSALLDAARSAAPHLTLVATGACGSMIRGLTALDPAPLAAFEPLLFTFHFYEPYLFSHQGAPWVQEPVYRSLNAVPWPASAGTYDGTMAAVRTRMAADDSRSPAAKRDAYATTERVIRQYFDANPARPFLDRYLALVSAWAGAHGIGCERIVMGEFGAVKTTGRIVASDAADRVRYIRDTREAAETIGVGWAFWNLFDSMGLMDDTTRAFDPDVLTALGMRLPRP